MSAIRATARCRVDLGGGTLDIWPLGLLHPGSVTVNVAIDVRAEIELVPGGDAYRVVQGGESLAAESLRALAEQPDGALVARLLSAFDPGPCEIRIATGSPRGAGLGDSSAIAVALLAATEIASDGATRLSALERARLARDLEAQLMGLPTGLQDHLPAQLGGALEIDHRPGGERVRALDIDLAALGERLVVAYTGQSHFSAGANWGVVRGRLDGDPDRVERLDRVARAASGMASALEAGDWATLGAAIDREWQARRGLSPEISTPTIETLLESAKELGAWGGKACGAGGGGCVLVLVPPAKRGELVAAWTSRGAQVLDAPPTRSGLELG